MSFFDYLIVPFGYVMQFCCWIFPNYLAALAVFTVLIQLLLCFIFSQRDFLLPAPLQGIFSARNAAARWCTFPCSKGQQGLYTICSLFYYTLCMV